MSERVIGKGLQLRLKNLRTVPCKERCGNALRELLNPTEGQANKMIELKEPYSGGPNPL